MTLELERPLLVQSSQEGLPGLYRQSPPVVEKVVYVNLPWSVQPDIDILYHRGRIKNKIARAEEKGDCPAYLQQELDELNGVVTDRNIPIPPEPNSVLIGRQWTLGLETEKGQ